MSSSITLIQFLIISIDQTIFAPNVPIATLTLSLVQRRKILGTDYLYK
jgi:hypothetical protein